MKISYNWLKQFIKIDWKSEEIAALLTDLGLEVEMVDKYESVKGGLEGIVVGHVLTCIQHPDAMFTKVYRNIAKTVIGYLDHYNEIASEKTRQQLTHFQLNKEIFYIHGIRCENLFKDIS